MAREYDHLFKLLIIGDSGKMADAKQRMRGKAFIVGKGVVTTVKRAVKRVMRATGGCEL